jgi:uncharacterized damage-inducible protein DinB
MEKNNLPEYWLRGPIEGILPVLQPVAHALLQAKQEIHEALVDFPAGLLWSRPSGVASIAFHLQHVAGFLDRLFTYARGGQLSGAQLSYLQTEGIKESHASLEELLRQFDKQVEKALAQLSQTTDEDIFKKREVGRKKIPSNTLGLLFHAAEHAQRHAGQLLVTARILR